MCVDFYHLAYHTHESSKVRINRWALQINGASKENSKNLVDSGSEANQKSRDSFLHSPPCAASLSPLLTKEVQPQP